LNTIPPFSDRSSNYQIAAGLRLALLIPVLLCLGSCGLAAAHHSVSSHLTSVSERLADVNASRESVAAFPAGVQSSTGLATESGLIPARTVRVVCGESLEQMELPLSVLCHVLPNHAFGLHSAAVCGSPTLFQLSVLLRI
jgi:hypothetical protein